MLLLTESWQHLQQQQTWLGDLLAVACSVQWVEGGRWGVGMLLIAFAARIKLVNALCVVGNGRR